MYKKLLVASLLVFAGAGCTVNTTASTTSDAPAGATDEASGMETGTGDSAANDEMVSAQVTIGTTVNTKDEGKDTEESATVKEFTVTGDNFTFSPTTMVVNKGDTVRITFVNSEGFHDLKIDEFAIATAKLNAGGTETIEFVADEAGTFEYYCTVGSHRAMGMKGTLTVE